MRSTTVKQEQNNISDLDTQDIVADSIELAERQNNNRTDSIPRSPENDYSHEMTRVRREFVENKSNVEFEHLNQYSCQPEETQGNIENFIGTCQIPIGMAGPLLIDGEHANDKFFIPLCTTEGSLVASYNRGMKLISDSGGVKTTVIEDSMQRSPVFVFNSCREAMKFSEWIVDNMEDIRQQAEATSNVATLEEIEHYIAGRFVYLRLNFKTGDAAGQNMVTKATFVACSWILNEYPSIEHYFLESNMATDKKSSQINTLKNRGKRVCAEVCIPRDLLVEYMNVEPEALHYFSEVANVGTFMAGNNNNGLHSINGLAAMFLATGQDAANLSESSAAILHNEITTEGDLYVALTLPSLIVGTYGGGTGLPTQRECLEMLGCYGKNKALKLAEIMASVALAGELSLASAISSLDWVRSHEQYGRNK